MLVMQFSSADVEETAELPQLQLVELKTVVACPLCATTDAVWSMTWRSSSTAMDVHVTMQRRLRQWKRPIFSSSLELVDIFVRNRGRHGGSVEGYFAAVLQHFSASVHLDVEAQGSGGGGDSGSLTPRCSATPIRCIY